MARRDVYPMAGRKARGYVLDVQADLLADLTTAQSSHCYPRRMCAQQCVTSTRCSGSMGSGTSC
jgi:hypothetical protein